MQVGSAVTAGFIVAVLVLAGCGSSGTSSSASSTSQTSATATSGSSSPPAPRRRASPALGLAANPAGLLRYNKTSLTANAGTVTIRFTNDSSLPHNVTVAASNGTVLDATPTFQGGTRTLTVELHPGVYSFYCSVPGHRGAGMQGKLIVR